MALASPHIGSAPGVAGLSGMHHQPLRAFAQRAHLALVVHGVDGGLGTECGRGGGLGTLDQRGIVGCPGGGRARPAAEPDAPRRTSVFIGYSPCAFTMMRKTAVFEIGLSP